MRPGLALLLIGSACALFADLAGYEDRIARHVGPPNELVEGSSGEIFVRTDANVVARLSADSGDIQWRYAAVRGKLYS